MAPFLVYARRAARPALALAAALALAWGALGALQTGAQSPALPVDLALETGLRDEPDNVIEPNAKTNARVRLVYTGEFQPLTVTDGDLRIQETNPRDLDPVFTDGATDHRLDISPQVLIAPETALEAPGGLPDGGQFGRAVASDGEHIAVGGGGKVQIYNAATGAKVRELTTPSRTGFADTVEGDDNLFGASVAIAGDYVVIGAPGASVEYAAEAADDADTSHDDETAARTVADAGRVYIFNISGGALQATYTPTRATAFPNADSEDGIRFGASVAIDSAGRTAFVGAPLASPASDAARTGAVYVFFYNTAQDKWAPTQNAMVTTEGFVDVNNSDSVVLYWDAAKTNGSSNGIDEAGVGTALALSGDDKVLAVGAPKADQDVVNGMDSQTPPQPTTAHTADIGAVLVFTRPPDTPGANPGDPDTPGVWVDDNAPVRLDIDPNLDDDASIDAVREVGRVVGVSDNGQVIAAEGAGVLPAEGVTASWKGAAFVWEGPAPADARNAPAWPAASYATARLTGSDSAAGDRFGSAVAVKGDGSQILVADAEAAANLRRGGVWLFAKPTNGWDKRDESASPAPPTQTAAVPFPTDGAAAVAATSTEGGLDELAAAKRLPRQFSSGPNAFYGAALAWVEVPAKDAVPDDPLTTETDESKPARDAMTRAVVGQPENSDLRAVANPQKGDAWLVDNFNGGDVGCRSTTDDPPKHTCELELGNSEIDLAGLQKEDNFQIDGTVNVQGRTEAYTDDYAVQVGILREVNKVTISYDQTAPTGDSVLGGDTVKFKVEILNEKNGAADPAHISTIQISAAGGSLSGLSGCSGVTCSVNPSTLSTSGDNSTKNIRFSWRTPRATGSKAITATVIGNSNEPDPPGTKRATKRLTITGSPASLAIAAHTTSVYYRPTGNDNRDVARLEVTARDDENKAVAVPDSIRRWDVKFGRSGGGASAKSQFSLEREVDERSKKVYVKLSVTGRDLDPGIYLLEVTMARAEGTRSFTVSGPPSTVEIEVEGQRTITGQLTYTARLRDSRRAAVTDGTPVSFEVVQSGNTVLAPNENVTRRTSRGRAETQYIVVGTGRAIVRACAAGGSPCDVSFISVGGVLGGGGPVFTPPTTTTPAVVAPPPPPPAEQLSERALGKVVTWEGAGVVRGSALLDSVTEATVVMLWNGKEWLPYGRIGLTVIPGSIDFVASNGASLWFGPAPAPPAAESEDDGESEGEESEGEDDGENEDDS